VNVWASSPSFESCLRSIDDAETPDTMMRIIAKACRYMRQEYGDIVRMILYTVPQKRNWPESLPRRPINIGALFRELAVALRKLIAPAMGVIRNRRSTSSGYISGNGRFSLSLMTTGGRTDVWSYGCTKQQPGADTSQMTQH
jgi:hypothetical protein